MSRIGWLLVVLLVAGWLATQVRLPQPSAASRRTACWRRTKDGWEEATWLVAQIPVRRAALHPAVVGLLELLLSMLALVALSGRTRRTSPPGSCPPKEHLQRNEARRPRPAPKRACPMPGT